MFDVLENRQHKKLRISSTIEDVCSLTDSGVAKFHLNQHDVAEKCFTLALAQVDDSVFDHLQHDNALSSSLMGLHYHNSLVMMKFDVRKNATSITSCTSDDRCASSNTDESKLKQRQKYDEGMQVYNEPLYPYDDMNTVASTLMYNIAQTHASRHQYESAQAWFERSHKRRQLSADYGNVVMDAMVVHNLAYCFYRMGNNEQALKYYQQAMSLVQARGNASSKDLAACFNSIGVIQFHSKDEKAAIDMFQRSLELYRSFSEKSDDDIVTSIAIATVLNNIGRVYFVQEMFNNALLVYKNALESRKKHLGHASVDVAATLYNIAQTYHSIGQLDDAMESYEDFLVIVQRKFGEETTEMAYAYRGMAEINEDRCDLKSAFDLYKKALSVQQKFLGNTHLEVGSTLNRLGNLCYNMHEYQQSLEYYMKGLKVEQSLLAKNHPDIVITMTNIAHVKKQMGKHKEALSMYRQVKSMQEKAFGPVSIQVAQSMSNIGLMQYHGKQFEDAFESYQEALRIRREMYNTDEHPDIASTLNSIGLILFRQDMFDLAMKCFKECLDLRRKIYSETSREVAIAWYNLATVHFEMGSDDDAIKLYKEAIRVEKAALGDNHPDVIETLLHLASILQKLGRLDEALVHFMEALEIQRSRTDAKNSNTALFRILNLVGNLHLQRGDAGEMMKYYVEASRIYELEQQPREGLLIAGYNLYGYSKVFPASAAMA